MSFPVLRRRLATCTSLVRKGLDDAAISDAPPALATIVQAAQFCRQPTKVRHLALDLCEMRSGETIYVRAVLLLAGRQPQQVANLVEREPEVAAPADEAEPRHVPAIVGAI